MSFPELTASGEFQETAARVDIEVPGRCEWRFEVPFKLIMKLRVRDGVGEIFGTELPNDVDLRLTGCKLAVYAPLAGGCRLQYEVVPNEENANVTSEDGHITEYVSDESPVAQYARLHFALEVRRQEAATDARKTGPRVAVVGGGGSGKTALARVLVAYAQKSGRTPMLVNLDPRAGVFSLPGSLTATPISDFLHVESTNGWGGSTTSGATFHNPKQPLVKSYGFYDMADNPDLYQHQAAQLGAAAEARSAQDPAVRAAGFVVDTPALALRDVAAIDAVCAAFRVDVVVVMGNDKLAVELRRRHAAAIAADRMAVVKMPASGAVAAVDDEYTRKVQEETIKEYFNGTHSTRLSPYKTDVDIKNFVIYKAVRLSEYHSQLAFLPAGDSYTADDDAADGARTDDAALDKFFVRLDEPTSSNLENSILAITHVPATAGTTVSPRDLLHASVMGYAHVSKVDDAKQKMSLLLPFPGQVPRHVLIATSIGYTE